MTPGESKSRLYSTNLLRATLSDVLKNEPVSRIWLRTSGSAGKDISRRDADSCQYAATTRTRIGPSWW
jgi:hypothetical protein